MAIGQHFGSTKLKAYKEEGSRFILCHDKDNEEYIHNLQPDGLFESGIYRYRWASGNTTIGSQYFRRSGREDSRNYRLFRDNKSGNIQYHDQIKGKDDSGWKFQAKYRFNPETLDWTKLDV